jgi:uncharacterized protein
LLWEGDVLRVYALCAPLILVLRKVPPRWLLGVGSTLVLASALVAVGAQRDVPPDGAGLGTFWFVGGGEIGDSVGVFLLADFFLRSAGMMLIGVALYRLGIVQGQRSPELYRRMARYGLGIGLPLAVAGVVLQIVDGFSPRIAIVGEVPNTLATIPVTLGYLGLASLWNRRPATPAHHRTRAVGRMALTGEQWTAMRPGE